MIKIIFFILILITLINCQPNSTISLYQFPFFQGSYLNINCSSCAIPTLGSFNDKTSSLIVPLIENNYTWVTVYNLMDYKGNYRTFASDNTSGPAKILDLSIFRFEKIVESLTIRSTNITEIPKLTIFDEVNFNGNLSIIYPNSFSNLKEIGWSDRIASFRLDPLGKVIFWNLPYFEGLSIQYSSSVEPIEIPEMPLAWDSIIGSMVMATV